MANSEDNYPQSFFCPLTLQIMKDPVVDPEGNSYEREAIESWLLKEGSSPITRNPLNITDLIPNRALREAIEERLGGNPIPQIKSNPKVQPVENQPSQTKDGAPSLSIYGSKPEDKNEATFLVTIQPPIGTDPTPVDICCVVDVSGSMGTEATMQNQQGSKESHGLSLLDIVKHAVKTVINVLQPGDRLSIVSYSTNAKKILDLTHMDAKGKSKAEEELDILDSDGQTNLWAGLHTGLEILRTSTKLGRLAAVLLLTDGQPNIEPPRGHIPMLQKYKDEHKQLSCTINTFGFGYNLDSPLLKDLAIEGNGMYAFIPDSGFVGTAFVNSTSNLLATMGRNVKLALEPQNGATIEEGSVLGYPCQYTSWGALVNVSSLQYEQTKGVVVKVKLPYGASLDRGYLSATLKYESKDDATDKPHEVRCDADMYCWDKTGHAEIEMQHWRLMAVQSIQESLKLRKQGQVDGSKNVIKTLIQDIKASSVAKQPSIQGLLQDLEGQTTEALSRDDYFTKWGVHYLPSLVNAHLLQMCNNFKDPGIQLYGGKLFQKLRDHADEVFNRLPPPAPKPSPYASYASSYGGNNFSNFTYAPVSSMSVYNSSANPCFHGNAVVQMADGSFKNVKDVAKGDLVMSLNRKSAQVLCVVKTHCEGNRALLVELPGGLLVTPFHPVQQNGKWVHPLNVAPVQEHACNAVYSFVLASEHTMLINDVACVSLGHNFEGEVVGHPYFGSQLVVEDLKKMKGWSDGLVQFKSGCLVRNRESNLVCCLNPELVI